MLDNKYFKPSMHRVLSGKRVKARKEHKRITYDCFNARLSTEGVCCGKDHSFTGYINGYMPSITCLEGKLSATCKKCNDYNDKEY